MINPQVVENFLKRKLANYDFIKSCGEATLDADLGPLSPLTALGSVKLWSHQKACLLLLQELKRFMLFLDMGGGKTLITLSLLHCRKQRGEKPKAIVFVPYITSVETWVEEVSKHCPSLRIAALTGSGADNLATLQTTEADLYVICYQSAVAMVSDKSGEEWKLPPGVGDLFSSFDTLVCDELHKCKNIHSLTYKLCRAIAARTEYALGLTGTPFGRDLADLWPQFNLIDFGETLGTTLGLYRAAYFTQKKNYWGGFEYKFKAKLLPTLKQQIKNSSISYTVDEFTDMPPKEYIVRHLPAPEDSKGYRDRAILDLNEGIKGQNYQAVQSNYLQLRQLSSGFMTLKGDDNDKVQVQFDSNPKLEVLLALIEEMPVHCKAVVFHHFVYTSSLISGALRGIKTKHARIWGGQKDPIGELRKFKSQDDCRVLVINWKSGSSSLNLQGANYLIVFEQPESPIDRKQGEARVWRPGQQQRVFIYDLLVHDTVDERLHKANEAGRSLLQELLNDKPR